MENKWEDYQPRVNDLISLRQAAKISGLSPNHLRLLVGKGIMWGIKIDTFWATTEEAVIAYLALERRTGPKPKKANTLIIESHHRTFITPYCAIRISETRRARWAAVLVSFGRDDEFFSSSSSFLPEPLHQVGLIQAGVFLYPTYF